MPTPSEPVPSIPLPAPLGKTTRLELRFGEPITKAFEEPGVDLAVLLNRASLSQVKTLDVDLGELPFVPDAQTSIVDLIERLPTIQELTLRLRGTPVANQTSLAVSLCGGLRRRGLTVAADFNLDAEANVFEALDEQPKTGDGTSLAAVLEASRTLRTHGVTVRWIVPLLSPLVYRLEALFSLARDEGVDPVLAPAWLLDPTQARPDADLTEEDRLFVLDFITYRLLDEEKHLHSADRTKAYEALRNALISSGTLAIAPGRNGAVLRAVEGERGLQWSLAYENRSRVGATAEKSQSSRFERFENTHAGRFVGKAIETGGVVLEGSLALAEWMRAGASDLTRRRRHLKKGRRFERVLLIGAYGGEHIGDAAILGGVLLRINRLYGTTEAILMSQRPAHTRHLISMLDTPFKIEVEAYEHAKIRERLPQVDAVVFAGGPLIDLPKQLVKHLYSVALGRRSGKPFIAEGIGPGPFRRRLSEWTARRIVRMAEHISIRTSEGSESRLMKGLNPEVGRDPAFDYLATRGTELTRLRAQDRHWIERLLENTEGRLLVGLNLRPIRHLYTVGVSAIKRAEYTRLVEARFTERLAEGMRLFHQASSVPPCFIFVPMNAIQFGMSDLRSAYRLKRRLRGDVDFRVWEGDASLDGVVALLRRLDIIISMRFHATIFALAQRRRVIGIDYRVGKQDKVGALLNDFGQSENCTRIDELTSPWLFQRLQALAADHTARTQQ